MKLLQGFKVLTLEKSGKVELETHSTGLCFACGNADNRILGFQIVHGFSSDFSLYLT